MPAADGAQSFQRLTRAAMAMLDPLFDERPGRGPRELAADLAERIGECAQVAEAAGLRSLNYLATLLVPYAQRQAAGADWPSSRARIETWIADVVAFCAGHFDAIDAAQLVECLRDWPDFPPVPEQFVALISSRLGQDAARIDALARAAAALDDDGPSAPPASGARASATGGPGAPDARASAAGRETPVSAAADGRADDPDAVATGRDAVASNASATDRRGAGLVPERRPLAVGTKPSEVARDELDMLAEAVESLASETLPALAVPMQAYGDEGQASVVEAAELCAERFGHFVNAMSFVGFEPLAQLLELARDSLGRWRDDPSSLDDAGRAALMALPATLIGYLRDPTPAGGRALAEALAGDAWPVSLASPSIDAVADALARVGLVGSRQVARPETEFGEDDVSLDIAPDADARVVDHLRRELPVLSARLSESIGRVLAGSLDDIASAQRTAHTLKGTANTVGIRGIATLTHLLEDLLQLLAKARRLPPAPLRDPIAQATDCVAEMAEAVAGIGPPPAGALAILRETARWIGRLLEDDVPEEDAPAAGDVDTVPADADADADATPTSISTSIGTATSIVTAASTGMATAATAAGGTGAGRPSVAPPDSPAPSASPAPPAPSGGDEEMLRVPAGVVDRMLDLAGEAAILLAQVQEQMSRLDETRDAFRAGTERLSQLSHELGRLVDTRGVSLSGRKHAGQFDALEFDEFNELHMVSRRIAESGADGKLLEQQLDQQAHVLADSVSRLERVQADLRETVMRSRMVTVATIVPRLQRAVRQAARMSGKPAQLVVRGEGAEVDAQLLQALVDPLTHLLRNAVDHGIEPAAQRARAGKPEEGRVELDVERQGHHLLIRCADDGGGLDDDAIRARAVELGMIDASARPDRAALARLVLQPGFSTRRSATQLSGRGIGLDVVARAVAQLRGTIEIASEPGRGTQILLSAPERVAAEPVTVARTSTHVLALSIRGVEQILAADGVADDENGVPRFVWQDGFVPVCRLDEAIGLPSGYFARQRAGGAGAAAGRDAPAPEVAMLVRMDAGHLVALIAPDLSQMRNAVLRPLPSWLARPVAVEGAAVLGDGTVAPVLDLPRLLAAQADAPAAAFAFDDAPLGRRAPVCLVVDDSVSVRRSMEAFLRDLGLEVECAGDGLEALAAIERRLPDVAIIDLEMPNMDGLELASTLRHQERTCELPLIMITSRFSEKHRAMALDAGVDAFLTKPYGEDELASHVRRCLERHASLG